MLETKGRRSQACGDVELGVPTVCVILAHSHLLGELDSGASPQFKPRPQFTGPQFKPALFTSPGMTRAQGSVARGSVARGARMAAPLAEEQGAEMGRRRC